MNKINAIILLPHTRREMYSEKDRIKTKSAKDKLKLWSFGKYADIDLLQQTCDVYLDYSTLIADQNLRKHVYGSAI